MCIRDERPIQRIMTNSREVYESACIGAYRLFEMGVELTDYELDLACQGVMLIRKKFTALDVAAYPETEYGRELSK